MNVHFNGRQSGYLVTPKNHGKLKRELENSGKIHYYADHFFFVKLDSIMFNDIIKSNEKGIKNKWFPKQRSNYDDPSIN